MGLRLSFGFGPLRASVPLTGKKRKRRKGRSFHGVVKSARGRIIWKCSHNHQTMEAAEACGVRQRRKMETGSGRAR